MTVDVRHPTAEDLAAALADVRSSPRDRGVLRLHVGAAVIEVTAQPHRGCAKSAAPFSVVRP